MELHAEPRADAPPPWDLRAKGLSRDNEVAS